MILAALLLTAPFVPVTVERGDLPIVLSAPHGGRTRLPDVPDRTGQGIPAGTPKASGFQTALDAGTDALARATADAIFKKMGKRPFLVVSHVTRKQMDPNRPESFAAESDAARTVYRIYHTALADARAEILRRFGAGLLLDLHGQGSTKGAVYRGTANGATVAHLVASSGRAALVAPEGLLGFLEKKGWRFIPGAAQEGKQESAGLSGGYIVHHYGATPDGMTEVGGVEPFDAIQLEFGADYRKPAAIPATAEVLADALATFAARYLPKTEKKGETFSRAEVVKPPSRTL